MNGCRMSISSAAEEPLLCVRDLDAGYGRSQVLFGLGFQIGPTETVAVVGRNGAGKTTFLQSLMGEIRPSQGQITLDGRDISHTDSARRALSGLGYVPQDTPVFMRLSVRDNLRAGAVNHRGLDDIDRVLTLFPKLRNRLDQVAGTLSGGERKMLGICRALLGQPKVLMLDEPTEGVWIGVIDEIAEQLAELSKTMAILLVEQHLDLVMKIADRIDVMNRGRIVMSGRATETAAHPDFLRWLAP